VLLLETTARAVAAILRQGGGDSSTLSPLSAASALRTLSAIVALARSEGRTWQEIADALGVTRQAPHHRFAGGGDTQAPACPPQPLDRAVSIVEAIVTGSFADATICFDDRMRQGATLRAAERRSTPTPP
jgi:hypothetical protein